MNTLRLPQFTIESSGMRKSKSMEPLSFLKESISSRNSSPLPGALKTFVDDFHFDSLEPRSKSTEPAVFTIGGGSKQHRLNEEQVAVEQLRAELILSGISVESIYSVGGWRGFQNDDNDIKFRDSHQAQRSCSLDAVTEDDLLTKGLIVPTDARRSCSLLEKSDEHWLCLSDNLLRSGLCSNK